MTYDLKVILKYCGRSSHDLLVLCGWSWPISEPLLAVLCHSWSLCWRSWPLSGPLLAFLCRSWGLCWRSWAACCFFDIFLRHFRWMVDREVALGDYVGGLGPLLDPMLAVLGRSWGLCWRSWAALKAYVGGLGSRSGPMWAVLGADQGLSWRSWPVLGPKRSVLERYIKNL